MIWISTKDRLPEENVSVLVFIPEEDNHITTGMWDVSKKWVLLDEYRVPKSQVTYWHEMIPAPEDKSFQRVYHRISEDDTMSNTIRKLQKQNYDLTAALNQAKEALKKVLPVIRGGDRRFYSIEFEIEKNIYELKKILGEPTAQGD